MLELGRRPASTPVRPDVDPRGWREHRFGLPEERWQRLSGQVVWVTGAGTGFGRALSIVLAAAGARVVLTGRRAGKLDATLAEARALGIATDGCLSLPADLAVESSIVHAVETLRAVGPLNALVNNAAAPCPPLRHPLAEMRLEDWDALMRLNVTAGWRLTQAALPLMTSAVRVLFVTSEAGWAFTPGYGPYNVSKAALNSLAASLGAELAARFPRRDVQVNALDPGQAASEMNPSSPESPYTIVSMALALLSCAAGGPNGRFFHKDGRHLPFAHAAPHDRPLL